MNKTTPVDVQNEFYHNMCDVNWTRFTKGDRGYLKMKIAYALCGSPTEDGDMANLTKELKGYTARQSESINELFELIVSHAKYSLNKEDIYLSIVFVVCMQPKQTLFVHKIIMPDSAWVDLKSRSDIDMWVVPVFAIRRCHPTVYNSGQEPCRLYIDSECRVYKSWSSYLNENQLSKCHMLVPKDGMYNNHEEKPIFYVMKSPAFSPSAQVLKAIDMGGTVASVGAAVVLIAGGPAVLGGALLTGAVTGIYGIARSSVALNDRVEHEQSISMTNPEARGCWLNIGMSTVGIASSGTTKLLQRVAASGSGASKVGRALQGTVDAFRIANVGLSGIGLANGIGSSIYKWLIYDECPSKLECFQIATSILFFTNSVVSNKTAAQIVSDAEAQTITNYRDSLRSNRHRKTFDKMALETKRINGNIIKGIRSIGNKDEFFASMTKMNKELNKNGVKMSFGSEGKALLNGQQSVDPSDMYRMGSGGRAKVYSDLGGPSRASGPRPAVKVVPGDASASGPLAAVKVIPGDAAADASTSSSYSLFSSLMEFIPSRNLREKIEIGNFIFEMTDFDKAINYLASLLSNWSKTVHRAIMRLVINLLEKLVGDTCEKFELMYKNSDKISETVEFILDFIRMQIGVNSSNEIDLDFVNVLKEFFKNGQISRSIFERMLSNFYECIDNWYKSFSKTNKSLSKCQICGYDRILYTTGIESACK